MKTGGTHKVSWSNQFSTATMIPVGWPKNWGPIPESDMVLFSTESRLGPILGVTGRSVKLLIQIHPLPRLRLGDVVSPILRTSS
jgi:hypothetical protein